MIFTVSASINSYASYEGHEENLGREGPPPAGPYRLGYKELERAIKIEKKGKIKKAKIKYEKALEYNKESLKIFKKVLPPNHPYLTNIYKYIY